MYNVPIRVDRVVNLSMHRDTVQTKSYTVNTMTNDPSGATAEGLPLDLSGEQGFAELEFEPWPQGPGEFQPLTNEEWMAEVNPTLLTVRLAFAINTKTKSELINSVDNFDKEELIGFLDKLDETRGWFQTHVDLIASAQARIFRAAANVTLKNHPAKAVAVDHKPADPLAEMIAEYRRQIAIFSARLGMTNEEADAFAEETFAPVWRRLRDDPPAATTREGALDALRLAYEEMEHSHGSFERPLVGVALTYLEGEVR